MNAIIEESPTVLISSENTGNTENNSSLSSNNKALDESDLFPSTTLGIGNQWEQTDLSNNSHLSEELPAVPNRYKVLDIDGETASLSGQWDYRNKDGKFLFRTQRFDTLTGRKEFRPLTLSGNKWVRKAPIEPRPLYGLDRLAARPDAQVLICEGEKSADAAARLFPDMVTISSMKGANSPEKSDWSVLEGRVVVLWGDSDQPGEQYIITVEKLATTAGANVIHCIRREWFLKTGIELGIMREALPTDWDAADAEQEGFTAENIQQFLDQERLDQPENLLLGYTPNQLLEMAAEPAQNSGQEDMCNAGSNSIQIRELFKDSEFAVIEGLKGFRDGVYWQEPCSDNDEPKRPLFLSSPLILVAETRDIDQCNWGRHLCWLDNDGYMHHLTCPLEMLAAADTSEFRRKLMRNGLTISTNSKARQKLADYVLNHPPQSLERVSVVSIK